MKSNPPAKGAARPPRVADASAQPDLDESGSDDDFFGLSRLARPRDLAAAKPQESPAEIRPSPTAAKEPPKEDTPKPKKRPRSPESPEEPALPKNELRRLGTAAIQTRTVVQEQQLRNIVVDDNDRAKVEANSGALMGGSGGLNPTGAQKRRHHITAVALDAKRQEHIRAQARATRSAQSRARAQQYGW